MDPALRTGLRSPALSPNDTSSADTHRPDSHHAQLLHSPICCLPCPRGCARQRSASVSGSRLCGTDASGETSSPWMGSWWAEQDAHQEPPCRASGSPDFSTASVDVGLCAESRCLHGARCSSSTCPADGNGKRAGFADAGRLSLRRHSVRARQGDFERYCGHTRGPSQSVQVVHLRSC